MRRALGYLAAIAIVLLGWTLASEIIDSPVLPTPWMSLPLIVKNIDRLVPDFLISLYRVVAAMLAGTLIAMPLGLVIGRAPKLDAIFGPLLYLLYPIPKIVLLPVLLVLLGLGNTPKIALIALTIFFQVLVTVRDAAKIVPEAAVSSIRSLGATRFDVFWHVVLPASLPELFTALRISSGTAVAILFFAEAIAGSTGLGYYIVNSWALINYPAMFAGIIAMALLGVVLYEFCDLCEHLLSRRRRVGR